MYYARLSVSEPVQRLKFQADVASNSDRQHLTLLDLGKRQKLTDKHTNGRPAQPLRRPEQSSNALR